MKSPGRPGKLIRVANLFLLEGIVVINVEGTTLLMHCSGGLGIT